MIHFNFLNYYRDLAINTYDVDPFVFMIIYLASIPIFYYTLFIMGKVIYHLKQEHNLKGKEIIKHREFIKALIINQIAWISPYLYVMFFGKNLPIWFWLFLALWLGITLFFYCTLHYLCANHYE